VQYAPTVPAGTGDAPERRAFSQVSASFVGFLGSPAADLRVGPAGHGAPCEDREVMTHPLASPILDWYAAHQRDLPWRRPEATPWAILVSEVMLQQTPVSRVLPAYGEWLARWPRPADLAAAPAGEAVRAWGRLGYPRRAIRLHLTAQALVDRHEGQVPVSLEALRALPGIGAYTAAAVASFAFGQRHAVLDTNVRRVLGRVADGRELAPPSLSVAERRLAESLLPETPAVAARWSVAVMELGALVCTAARPGCPRCPVADQCAWRRAGHPPGDGPRRSQGYEGTDRQCRGRLLAVLRAADGPVPGAALDAAWPDPRQRARALDGLVADDLVDPLPDGQFALPGLHVPYPAERVATVP
jgi:A/G-specific adenine glycosylase